MLVVNDDYRALSNCRLRKVKRFRQVGAARYGERLCLGGSVDIQFGLRCGSADSHVAVIEDDHVVEGPIAFEIAVRQKVQSSSQRLQGMAGVAGIAVVETQ